MKEGLILGIDTATDICSVSLSLNGELLVERNHDEKNKASEVINVLINEILREVDFSLKDLSAVAISGGPGSYTGLRVGCSTAKGLCYGLGIPLIHVPTLQAMVNGVIMRYGQSGFDYYMPMIDARRMEVFMSVFNEGLQEIQPSKSSVIDQSFFMENDLKGKILVFGNGAAKCEELCNDDRFIFFTDFKTLSTDLCYLSYILSIKKLYEDLAYYEPQYLKEAFVIKSGNK